MGRRPPPRGRPAQRRRPGPVLPWCEVDQSCLNKSTVAFMGKTFGGTEEWSEPVTVMSCHFHATAFEVRHPEMERRDLKAA